MNKEIKKFTIGIEEEYMVCNPQDGNLVDKASFIMDSFKDSERFSYELIESEIEANTSVHYEINDAIFPEELSKFKGPAFVTALSTRLKQAVSIDNGIMHMMGLSNIPMIVLFGPTSSDKFAPKINEIKILDSKILYSSTDINKISVEDVINNLN